VKCPKCKENSIVVRITHDKITSAIFRKRRCTTCKHQFTTEEIYDAKEIRTIQKASK